MPLKMDLVPVPPRSSLHSQLVRHDGAHLQSQYLREEAREWGIQGHPCQHSKFKISLDYMRSSLKQLKTKGWGDGLVVKSFWCSYRGPKFGFQHACAKAHNHLELQLQGNLISSCSFSGHCTHTGTYIKLKMRVRLSLLPHLPWSPHLLSFALLQETYRSLA